MPSLILRLEKLPQSAVPTQSTEVSEPADMIDVDAPPVVGVVADNELPNLSDTRTATHGIGTARHVLQTPMVDLRTASPEVSGAGSELTRWSAAVASAFDGCLLVDVGGVLLSTSVAAVALIGAGDTAIIGRHLLDVLRLVDFETGAESPDYAARITALVVLDGPGLARSLMRVRHNTGAVVTLDASSAPIHDSTGQLLGSITFIAPIPSR